MSNLQNMIFGPLNSDACLYFYFLTAFFYFLLVISLIAGIIFIVKKPNQFNFNTGMNGLLLLFNIFIAYFVNRLLYTMCSKSLA
jgi:hypothetical protein